MEGLGVEWSGAEKSLECIQRNNSSGEVFGVERNVAPELEGHGTEWSGGGLIPFYSGI